MSLTTQATAQQRRFKVTPIKKLDFIPGEAHSTAGINNKGQIVYGYFSSGAYHAFVWLPSADYGFTIPGNYDLAACIGFENTIARDINESGFAVGYAGTIGVNTGRAIVWPLSGGSSTCVPVGTLPNSAYGPPLQSYSSAYAINDDNPPIVVGDSAVRFPCGCNVTTLDDMVRGFQAAYTGGGSTLIELQPAISRVASYARDVNTPLSIVGGYMECRNIGAVLKDAPVCDPALPCQYGKDPVRWPSPVNPLAMSRLSSAGLEVHDLNNKSTGPELVGWGLIPAAGFDCLKRATYWQSPGAAATDLGAVLPSNDASTAEAINNLTPAQIVGADLFSGSAVLWEYVSGSWVALDLNCPGAIGNCLCTCSGTACGSQCGTSCPRHWNLIQGHDINDSGWIVAYGRLINTMSVNLPTDFGGNYLVLLTPDVRCPADVTGNGCINIDDLVAVITTWGTNCGPGQFCTNADVNCDYVVNIDDLVAVNTSWCPGSCGGVCCVNCPPCSGAGMMSGPAGSESGGATGPLSAGELIALVTMSNQPAQIQAEIIEQILQQY